MPCGVLVCAVAEMVKVSRQIAGIMKAKGVSLYLPALHSAHLLVLTRVHEQAPEAHTFKVVPMRFYPNYDSDQTGNHPSRNPPSWLNQSLLLRC